MAKQMARKPPLGTPRIMAQYPPDTLENQLNSVAAARKALAVLETVIKTEMANIARGQTGPSYDVLSEQALATMTVAMICQGFGPGNFQLAHGMAISAAKGDVDAGTNTDTLARAGEDQEGPLS